MRVADPGWMTWRGGAAAGHRPVCRPGLRSTLWLMAWFASGWVWWLFGAQVQAQTLRCELLANATVSGAQVLFGDVVQVSVQGMDGAVPGQGMNGAVPGLLQKPLTAAPRVGQVAQLTRQEIEHWLRRVWPQRGVRIEWQGAQAVKLRRAQQTVAWDGLIDVAKAALQQELARRGQQAGTQTNAAQLSVAQPNVAQPNVAQTSVAQTSVAQTNVGPVSVVSVVPILPQTELVLPEGKIETEVRSLRADTLGARVPVWIDLKVDGEFYRAVSLMFALDGALPAPQDRVQRGASVVLRVVQGGVVLETPAVVQQDALVGSRVAVKPGQAAQAVMARVVSNSLVLAE